MASCLIEIKVKNENKWFWNYIEIQIMTAQNKMLVNQPVHFEK